MPLNILAGKHFNRHYERFWAIFFDLAVGAIWAFKQFISLHVLFTNSLQATFKVYQIATQSRGFCGQLHDQ